MNKWVELRDWLNGKKDEEMDDIPQYILEQVLSKMDELDEKAIQVAEQTDTDIFVISEEERERYQLWMQEQRERHPWFFKHYDSIVEANRRKEK